ncbi:MAG: hypothetical protein FJ104_00715, partial [Deltaproteobacteria bacterium]|nr:hypothetical protein [Deltaproteobacteria bacterium]
MLEAHREAAQGGTRIDAEVALAELQAGPLALPERALAGVERVLELAAHEPRAVALAQRLLADERTRDRAAQILSAEYEASGDGAREAEALRALLDTRTEPLERRELLARLATVHEEKLGAPGAALDVVLRALGEFPAELEIWGRASDLAARAQRHADLAEAYRIALATALPEAIELELAVDAARLHEERLGDPVGAAPYLERVLARNPGDDRAFTRLKQILTGAERWAELEALYDRAALATDDPATRAEMLAEVAMVCEEIMEAPAKATRYYERILEVDPNHDAALSALDRLYGQSERHADLAALLERRIGSAVAEAAVDMKLRLARLCLERLADAEGAIRHVEDVLVERPNDFDARQLAEKLLESAPHRVRATRILESVYDGREEWRDLARVLDLRLAALDEAAGPEAPVDDERRELLRRLAALRDEKLRDDAGALAALARFVPLDPLDEDARNRLLSIGRRVGQQPRVAEVLERASERADTSGMRAEILATVARLYEDELGQPAQAEATYRKVLALDPDDAVLALPAARALEKLALAVGDNQKLREAIEIQVRLESGTDARCELLSRLGHLDEDVLGDLDGATAAWTHCLEERPGDPEALAALDRIHERGAKWRELVRVLEQRRDRAEEPAARREFMQRIAALYADRLGEATDAVEAYRAILDEFGPAPDALEPLERLYLAAGRYAELADALEAHLDLADAAPIRLGLLARLGDLRVTHLGNASGAISAYRDALSLDAAHEPSRAALERLLGADDPAVRRDAAEILHPIYETDGDNARLLRVLEVEIATADDPETRLAGLEKAASVAAGPLADPALALTFVGRAVREAAAASELRPWLAELERLAALTSKRAEQVELLREIAGGIFDGDVQFEVTVRVAELARDALSDRSLARQWFEKALELRSDDAAVLLALEALYEGLGDGAALLRVLEQRTELAAEDSDRKALLYRRARILAATEGEKARAAELYESILDLGLEREALDALEALYSAQERWSDLVALHQREMDAPGAVAPDLHVKIARIADRRLHDLDRAFDELEAALESDRNHGGALAELEHLLGAAPDAAARARAATLLEPVYLVRGEYERVMATIRARLEASDEPAERRELLVRLAQLHEEQKEDYGSALETMALVLKEDLEDAGTVAELERLAKVGGAERRLAEIYAAELERVPENDAGTARLAARAGELFAGLGETARALSLTRRALAFEPESVPLFLAVDALLQKQGDAEGRVALYREALEHRFEPADRQALLHVVADLERGTLGRAEDAIHTLRQIVDGDEHDARALDALAELYSAGSRHRDLAELLLRRAEGAADAAEAARFRFELAKLHAGPLGEIGSAVDQLEEIVRVAPHHQEAVATLEALKAHDEHRERIVEILRPLYEGADDWRRLIKLNEDRFGLARDDAEKVAVLRETAQLWELRGTDPGRARRALGLAVELDPEDGDVRAEYERLVAATSAWDELTEIYEAVLAARPDLPSERDLLRRIGEVHDRHRDDPRRALVAYERVHALDPSDMEPLDKLEGLATLLSDWAALDRVLVAKAGLVVSDDERASLWRRVAEGRRDMLEDPAGAITAYDQALELEPDSAFTIDRLLELLEEGGTPARLVELYGRRVELTPADDTDLRYRLLMDSARRLEADLGDRSGAIEALGQALSARPGEREVLSALNRLYRAEGLWADLLDNLRLEAASADTTETRAALRREIGDILANRQSAFEEALDAYGLVLAESPGDAQVTRAVRRLAEEHEHLRGQAAGILVPVLTQQGAHEALVEVLELRLSTESEPPVRANTLRVMAEILEQRLARPADAEGALLRAMSELPEASDLHTEIERVAALASGFDRYADALTERAKATFDSSLARDLFARLGRVAHTRLGDDRRAVAAYLSAIEQVGDQPELLEALDGLYARLGDSTALADVLERRVGLSAPGRDQAELNYRLATVYTLEFKEPARGLASLRAALEQDPTHEGALEELEGLTDIADLFEEAAEVLERVYRAQGRTDRLAGLFEKRVKQAGTVGERRDLRRSLARVLEDEGRDATAALRVLELGLADDPTDSSLLDEIERLAAISGGWESAGKALREAVEKKVDLVPDVARDLLVRAAVWFRDRGALPRLAEETLTKALDFDASNDEVLVQIEQLQSGGGRERDLVATLRRRAKVVGDDETRLGLFRRARDLAVALDDRELAEAVLRELIGHDDSNTWALAELSGLRELAKDYKELVRLLLRRADLSVDATERRELRHRAARATRDELSDAAGATALFADLFSEDPTDEAAGVSLRALYEAGGKHKELASLLEKLCDVAASPASRGDLRLALARLRADKFADAAAAVSLLRSILEEEPGRADAVVELTSLFEREKRHADLAALLDEQIAGARDRGDVDGALTFQLRLASVREQALGDKAGAAQVYEAVLVSNAEHRPALEALARLYPGLGDDAGAARILGRLLSLASTAEEGVPLALSLAAVADKIGDADGAIAALERGLGFDAASARVRDPLRGAYERAAAWEKLAGLVAGDAELASSPDDQ